MKALSILLFLFVAEICAAQQLAKGDNIYTSFRQLKQTREAVMPAIGQWYEESNVTAIGEESPAGPPMVYFRMPSKKIVAAMDRAKNTVLIDMDGDSVIDAETDRLIIPAWAIIRPKAKAAKDTTALHIFNHLYQITLQADNNHVIDSATINILKRYRADTTMANRHIMYLFDSYQRLVADANKENRKPPKDLCLPIVDQLISECGLRLGKVPAVACIYKGEALLNAQLYSLAREHFKTWLAYYPNSIPLQVYDYRMEENKTEKARKKSLLLKNHPNHWMVKELDK